MSDLHAALAEWREYERQCDENGFAGWTDSQLANHMRRTAELRRALIDAYDVAEGRLRDGTTNYRWKVEWFETWPGESRRRRRTRVVSTEADADNWLKQCEPSETPRKLVRTIHTGPWQEVQP